MKANQNTGRPGAARGLLAAVLLASLATAGCAADTTATSTSAETTSPPTTTPSTTTATSTPTTAATAATPTTAVTTPSTPAEPAFVPPPVATFAPTGPSSATWDLVALGDSTVAGSGLLGGAAAAFPGVYAGLLAEEQGVTVVLHSYYSTDVRTIAAWAEEVRTDSSMRNDLAQAEIVVILIGFHDVLGPLVYGTCQGETAEIITCLEEATAHMPAAFSELYGEIAAVVPDTATVLVSDYMSGPAWAFWGDDPAWPQIRAAAYDGWRAGLEGAATAAGFRVVHTSTAFSDREGVPLFAADEILQLDLLHFNAMGHRIFAEAFLAEDGFAGS